MRGPSINVPAGMSLDEARIASKRFGVALCQKREIDAWWNPGAREVVIRRVGAENRAIPERAVPVGRYRAPYPARLFLDDLAEVIQIGGQP